MKKYSIKFISTFLVFLISCTFIFNSAFAAEDDIISFSDNNLKLALIINGADADNDGDITEGELAQCTQLCLNGYGISNLSGLQYAVNAEDIDLSCNNIADLTQLAGLTGLLRLNLSENSIENIDPIASLTALTHLYLNDNSISSITAISNMSSLNTLCLQNNSVTNLAALTGHLQLNYLNLAGNGITSLAGV